MEANSSGSVQQVMETSNLITGAAQENETTMTVVPEKEGSCRKLDSDTKEISSNSLSSYCSEAALSKTVEETNSYSPVLIPTEETNSIGIVSNETKDDRNLTVTNGSCDELHEHEAENESLPALHNPIEQPNREVCLFYLRFFLFSLLILVLSCFLLHSISSRKHTETNKHFQQFLMNEQMAMNASAESSIEEQINANPNTEKNDSQ